MALVVNAMPADATANSYLTRAEANSYFEGRLYSSKWDDADPTDQDKAIVMGTKTLDLMLSAYRMFVPPTTGVNANSGYYRTRPTWTGAPTTSTQALAWPRTSMYNRNGVAIASTVIPIELKEAVAELALSLLTSDRTADNDVAVQGITDLKAGPVSLSFDKGIATTKVLPDIVLYKLVPSWVSAEIIDQESTGLFDVVSD